MSGYDQPPNPTSLTDLHKAELQAADIPTSSPPMDPPSPNNQPTTVSNSLDRKGQPLTPPHSPSKPTFQQIQHPSETNRVHYNTDNDDKPTLSQPADVLPPSQDEPTFSHGLAAEHNPSKVEGSDAVAEGVDGQKVAIHHKDIGSNRGDTRADSEGVWGDPRELVHGKMSKEDFWVLVRRFNKVRKDRLEGIVG